MPDVLWDAFRRVAPPAPVRPQGGGRRRYGDREVLAAIVFVATSGCAWRDLPPVFGPSGPTAHRRFGEWGRAGVWEGLRGLPGEGAGARAGSAGELRWARGAVEAVAARGHARG